jgi:carbon storage regulator
MPSFAAELKSWKSYYRSSTRDGNVTRAADGVAAFSRSEPVLVLNRKTNQSIQIGDDITITVTEISGDTVKLGITAPRDVPVDRVEIRVAKERERENGA